MSSSSYNILDVRTERRTCVHFTSRYRNAMLFILCVSCMANALFYLSYAAGNSNFENNELFFMYQRSVVVQEMNNLDYQDENMDRKSIYENLSVSRKLQGESDLNHSSDSDDKVINPHNYNYVVNEPGICKGNGTIKLIVVVCTGLSNFDERQAIRETWGNYLNEPHINGRIIFLVGIGTDSHVQRKIFKESKTYKDIVQENFIDSYRNLSLKSVAVFKWVKDYCKSAEFVLKVDDDIFVNIPNLLKSLNEYVQHNLTKYIVGHVFVGARPVQDKNSKWYTPKEWFSEKVYPKYVSGTSYIVSKDAVEQLYNASLYLKPFWLEDIYITGLCARRAKVGHIHNPKISFSDRFPNGCAYRNAITGHKVRSLEMYKIYTQLTKKYLQCDL